MEYFNYEDASEIDYVYGSRIHAWLPAFDNYDTSEQFWRHYELSLLDENQRKQLYDEDLIAEFEIYECEWCYCWSVSIYYSVLVIGGNEMQPAQNFDLLFVVVMNICGLIFMTWIAGEISVLIFQLNT